jgi:hypothetical protein
VTPTVGLQQINLCVEHFRSNDTKTKNKQSQQNPYLTSVSKKKAQSWGQLLAPKVGGNSFERSLHRHFQRKKLKNVLKHSCDFTT